MAHGLSTGALGIIMRGDDYNEPIVQVISVKRMQSGSGNPDKDRYRAFLSDGQYSVSYAMMSAPIYAKTGENGLSKFTIIKIKRHMTSVINNTEGRDSRVLLILDLEVITPGEEVGEKIGNPIALDKAGAAPPSSSTAEAKRPAPSDFTSNSSTKSFYGDSAPPTKALKTSSNSIASDGNNVSLVGQITHPISSLSPYHNKWIIKARVTNKNEVRSWSNAKGSGQLFSFEVADESGEIRITGFKEAVDKYYDLIQIDKVYYISKCQLKTANKQFNNTKNDYEMTISSETIIEECHDDDMSNLQTKYNFVEIKKIADVETNQLADVIGVAKTTSDIQSFQAKSTGRELRKREVQLVDQSNTSITLTLWGTQADNFDGSGNPIVCIKGAKVGEFGGGKNISAVSGSSMRINPEIKECYRLKTWYETEGVHVETNDISARTGAGGYSTPWMCFKEVADQQIGSVNEKGDYYQVKATILLLRTENCLYKACAQPECNKKVVDGDGSYTCEKCGITSDSFKYRLLCSMNVGDWSGNQWVSMFSDEAEKVVGMTAQQAGELQSGDPLAFQEAMEKIHFKEFILKCRAKMEQYNDEQRIKTVAVRVDPVNYKEYNAHLISKIKQLTSCA